MDLAKALKLKTDWERIWSKCHSQMTDGEDLHDGNVKVKGNEGQVVDIPPHPARIVQSAVGAILTENLVTTIPPRKETQVEKERADKLEKSSNALVRILDKRLPLPLLHLLKHSAILYGLGIGKGPLWNPEAKRRPKKASKIPAWEAKRRSNFPIIVKVIDPRTVMFDMSSFPPKRVIETGKRSRDEIEETYNITLPGSGEEVNWVEAWDEDEGIYIAEGVEVGRVENLAGFVPYTFVLAPFGRLPSTKDMAYDPAAMIRGILFDSKTTLEALAQMSTDIAYAVSECAHPKQEYAGPPVDPDVMARMKDTGTILNLPTGGTFRWVDPPAIMGDLWKFHNEKLAELEQLTRSNLKVGLGQGEASGYQSALHYSWDSMASKTLIGNLERAMETLIVNIGRLITALDEEITVWGYSKDDGRQEETVTGQDWDGHYEVYCELSAVTPEEADRRGMTGTNYYKAGLISWETTLEKYLMLPNATEERNKMLVEKVLSEPAILELLANEAIKQAGREELIQKAAETPLRTPTPDMLAQMTGRGGIQPQGVPPAPPRGGSPEALGLRMRQLKRQGQLGGQGGQGEPMFTGRGAGYGQG